MQHDHRESELSGWRSLLYEKKGFNRRAIIAEEEKQVKTSQEAISITANNPIDTRASADLVR